MYANPQIGDAKTERHWRRRRDACRTASTAPDDVAFDLSYSHIGGFIAYPALILQLALSTYLGFKETMGSGEGSPLIPPPKPTGVKERLRDMGLARWACVGLGLIVAAGSWPKGKHEEVTGQRVVWVINLGTPLLAVVLPENARVGALGLSAVIRMAMEGYVVHVELRGGESSQLDSDIFKLCTNAVWCIGELAEVAALRVEVVDETTAATRAQILAGSAALLGVVSGLGVVRLFIDIEQSLIHRMH